MRDLPGSGDLPELSHKLREVGQLWASSKYQVACSDFSVFRSPLLKLLLNLRRDFRRRRKILRETLEQGDCFFGSLGSVVHGDGVGLAVLVAFPQRDAGV